MVLLSLYTSISPQVVKLVSLILVPFLVSSSSLLSIFSCDSVKNFMQGLVHNKSVWERGCPDHVTYCQYLWRCMDNFPGLAESKSKLFVPLLFDFIEYV